MKCAVFDFPDGRVGVLHATPKTMARLMAGGMSEDAAIRALAERDLPKDVKNIALIDDSELPDRSARDRWVRSQNGGVTVR